MVRIRAYTIADLRKLLESGSWFEGRPIPLTRERALSHVNNPRAEDADVALLVAYEGETVIAHLGILPDYVFAGEQRHRIGWLTAWWANPDRKHSGTGMMLLMRAFGLYKGGLGASGFSEAAKAVYGATKRFKTIKELTGITAFVRFDFIRVLARRLPALARARSCLRYVEALANLLIAPRLSLWRRRNPIPSGIRLEYVPELDAEAGRFLEGHAQNKLSRRGARELNWIARYSWMTCTLLTPPPAFEFETTARNDQSFHLKAYGPNKRLLAVMLLHVIDDHLIIPYCCHNDEPELVARIIGHHLVGLRLKRLTTFRAELLEQFARLRFPWVIKKQRIRPWVLSGPAGDIGSAPVAVQDGDGDCAFTV